MMVSYLILSMQLGEELENLARVVQSARTSIVGLQDHPEEANIYVNSAALEVHSFYVGLERMFLAIAEQVDRSVPSGSRWEVDLVNQMTYDLRAVRPAVIGDATRAKIHEYRAFRHVVRNVYTYQLDRERVVQLVEDLPDVFAAVRQDVQQFIEFLDAVADADVDGDDVV